MQPSNLTAIERQPDGSTERNALFLRHLPIVRQVVGGVQRRLPRSVSSDDLMSAGMTGLWDAVRRHGADPGERFALYVRMRIRGAVLDELRAQDWAPRRARSSSRQPAPIVVRLDEVSAAEHGRCLAARADAEEAAEQKLVRRTLKQAVEQLPERERRIVSLHYFRGVRFKDLGRMLGVSPPRISQLHSRAMDRLRGILEAA